MRELFTSTYTVLPFVILLPSTLCSEIGLVALNVLLTAICIPCFVKEGGNEMDSLTGIHMLVAITQHTINSELWRLYITPQDPTNPDSDFVISHTLETHHDPHIPGAGITAIIGSVDEGLAPTVELKFLTSTRRNVLFKVPLTAGKMNYWDVSADPPELKEIVIDHWVLAFDVNLDMVALSASSLATSGASKIAQQYLQQFSESEFTINRLALNFENADLANLDVKGSTVPSDPIAMETIIANLSRYFKGLRNSTNPYILGYPIKSNDPQQTQKILPAIEPTKTDFSTTPYISTSAGDTSHDDLSTLNFLLMTQGKDFPTDVNTGLFNQNWVTSDDVQGIMAISNQIFTSAYLNQLLIPAVSNALFSALHLPTPQATKTASGWSLYHEEKQTHVVIGSDSGIENIYADYTSRVSCDLSFSPSSKQVKGTGYFYRYAYYYETPFVAPNGIEVGDVTVQLNWTLTINFGVGDGLILLTYQLGKQGDPSIQTNENPLQQFGDLLGGNVGTVENAVANQYTQLENNELTQLLRNLSTCLNSLQNRVITPGGQIFFFKDLTFNQEQDLLVTLTYKDNVPTPTPRPHPTHW